MTDDLRARQQAAQNVEKRMMEFLVQFNPAEDLKLSDARSIAMFARTLAFEEFSPKNGP